MIIKRDDWLFFTGQAGSGKTEFMKAHIRKIPAGQAYIFDFNRNDYQEFKQTQNLWNVQSGSQEETEQFLKIVYEQGNNTVILDESDNYLLYPSEFIRKFVNTARNRGIGGLINAKRAKAIKPVYRNRFTHLVLFRVTIPEDIRYLESWSGLEKGQLEHLRKLNVGEHIIINLLSSEVSEVQKPIKIKR